jgi:transposase
MRCAAFRPSSRWQGHRHGRKRWVALTRYLEDGRLEIDHKIAERARRCVALAGKTGCSLDQRRGERNAAIYSAIKTAKLNGLESQADIADAIARIAGDWPASRWDELCLGNGSQMIT